MVRTARLAPFVMFALAGAASAQATVQVFAYQPLQLQGQISGGAVQTMTVAAGTDLTNSGAIQLNVTHAGLHGSTAVTVTPSQGPFGTTCEIQGSASFGLFPGANTFQSQESGEELVIFSSPTPVAGVLVAEAQFTPSTGPAMGTGTLSADFGFDGSVDLVAGFAGVARYARPCVLGPVQIFTVHVAHQGTLTGQQVGEYSTRVTLRFVPHADGFDFYGPTVGCRPAAVIYSLTGNSLLVCGLSSPPVDLHVLAIGTQPVSVAMPFPSPCPLLTSADLLIAGPFTNNSLALPFHAIPTGASVHMQFVGLRLATLTAEASRGIHGFGQ